MAEPTIQELMEKLDKMNERQDSLEKENAELKIQISEKAAEQIKEDPTKPLKVPEELLEHNGKKYKVAVAGFRKVGQEGSGEIISAAELFVDSKLVEEILKIKGQGILVPQV